MKRLARFAPLALSLAFFGPSAVAQQAAAPTQATLQSPSKYVLKLVCETTGCTANFSGNLSIDKALPDGTVSGKVTLAGLRCGANNADYTGRLDGDKLSIPMPLEPAVQCKGIVYEFTKKEGNRFEGKYNTTNIYGRPITLKITLDPAP
jgi:hypothetical protein